MSFDPSDCAPLSLTREITNFPIGNIPLHMHHQILCRMGSDIMSIHPQAWLDPTDAVPLLMDSETRTLVDGEGTVLAWLGATPDLSRSAEASNSFVIRYPWDLLKANEQCVAGLSAATHFPNVAGSMTPLNQGEIHPLAVIEGVVQTGPGTRILPGVFIEGNVVIGDNCKIGPNCYIRGNTSIGDKCHIGQSVEIKNCLILSNTNVGHLSYIGDSVLGEKVNLGAGTTTSNLRHDGKNHHSTVNGRLVDTGRRKFGTIIGDGVHTGINTSIYPGRKFWPRTTTRPGDVVQRDVME